MKDAGAVVGAAHSGVGNSDHVPHAGGEELFGNRQMAPLVHSGSTLRARIAQDENAVGIDLESGVVDSGVHFVVAIKNNCGTGMFEETRFSGGGFDDSAIGSEIASENRQAGRSVDGI